MTVAALWREHMSASSWCVYLMDMNAVLLMVLCLCFWGKASHLDPRPDRSLTPERLRVIGG